MNIDVFGDYNSGINFWHSDGNNVPEIISFTQLLKWNYANDYAAFIRYAYKTGCYIYQCFKRRCFDTTILCNRIQ